MPNNELGIPKFELSKAKDLEHQVQKVNAEDKRGTFIHFRISQKMFDELIAYTLKHGVTISCVARLMMKQQMKDMTKVTELIEMIK